MLHPQSSWSGILAPPALAVAHFSWAKLLAVPATLHRNCLRMSNCADQRPWILTKRRHGTRFPCDLQPRARSVGLPHPTPPGTSGPPAPTPDYCWVEIRVNLPATLRRAHRQLSLRTVDVTKASQFTPSLRSLVGLSFLSSSTVTWYCAVIRFRGRRAELQVWKNCRLHQRLNSMRRIWEVFFSVS